MRSRPEKRSFDETDKNDSKNGREGSHRWKLVSQRSRWKQALHRYKAMQVWGWLFKSCEINGRILLRDGLIDVKDVEECIMKGRCKKLGIKLPAWSILQCLLVSAKSSSSGLVISDDVELTKSNGPRDKVFDWFIGPLLVMKEQISILQLDGNEERALRYVFMKCKNETPEEWDNTEFPSADHVRRAQLQSIFRRLQGLVASMSRVPTFRRRFRSLVKALYIEAVQTAASGHHIGGTLNPGKGNPGSMGTDDGKESKEGDESVMDVAELSTCDDGNKSSMATEDRKESEEGNEIVVDVSEQIPCDDGNRSSMGSIYGKKPTEEGIVIVEVVEQNACEDENKSSVGNENRKEPKQGEVVVDVLGQNTYEDGNKSSMERENGKEPKESEVVVVDVVDRNTHHSRSKSSVGSENWKDTMEGEELVLDIEEQSTYGDANKNSMDSPNRKETKGEKELVRAVPKRNTCYNGTTVMGNEDQKDSEEVEEILRMWQN